MLLRDILDPAIQKLIGGGAVAPVGFTPMIQVSKDYGMPVIMSEAGYCQRRSTDITAQIFDGMNRVLGRFGKVNDSCFLALLIQQCSECAEGLQSVGKCEFTGFIRLA